MTGKEIMAELQHTRKPQHLFIKWWRRENDFVDFQLLDDFIDHLEPEQEFGGYDLLDMEQMWHVLERHGHGKVSREQHKNGEHLLWKRENHRGNLIVDDYPLTPQTLMTVFDSETRGDVLC